MAKDKITIGEQYPDYKEFFKNPDSTHYIELIPMNSIPLKLKWRNLTIDDKRRLIDKLLEWENEGVLILDEPCDEMSVPKENNEYIYNFASFVEEEEEELEREISESLSKEFNDLFEPIKSLPTRAKKLNYINQKLIEREYNPEWGNDFSDIEDPEIYFLLKEKIYWENYIEEDSEKKHFNLNWDSDKYELVELIYSLYKSNRIKKDNKPITLKDLTEVFETIFNIEIKGISDILTKGLNATKRAENEEYFLKELVKYIDDRVNELRNKP